MENRILAGWRTAAAALLLLVFFLPAFPARAESGLWAGAAPKVKVSNEEAQKLTVSWSSVPGARGYLVRYSLRPDMKKAKKLKTAETSLTIPDLAVHQKYYITVQAYTKVGGVKQYGTLSKIKPKRVTGILICIDPGHQAHGNKGKEPVGPGSKTLKKKVSDGTAGKWSKLSESELNLAVSLKLRKILEKRGYQVIMTRETQDVNITNIQRAKMANEAKADVMIRIHANSSGSQGLQGAETICITKKNPYPARKTYKKSKKLAKLVLENFVAATGAKRRKIWETDTMTGLNWSEVPAIILEMGYMSNRTEDLKFAKAAYQKKMARGIANGIDAYFQ